MAYPLEGIRVIDMTQYQQGPISTQQLADMGAEVIKVERCGVGDPGRKLGGFYFQANDRNKKSITVNTKTEKGREIVYRLVKTADIFAQNFQPGVAKRMGFGYEALSRINPGIVYLTGSAYGLKGPMGTNRGYDAVGQAMSGILSMVEHPEGKPISKIGCSVSDQTGGYLLAFGAMVALFHRERTGEGQEVDASLLGSTMNLIGYEFQKQLTHAHLANKEGLMRERASRSAEVGFSSGHVAKNGKALYLVLSRRSLQIAGLKALGLERLIDDPRRENPEHVVQYVEEVLAAIEARIRTKDRDEWLRLIDEAGGIAAPINSLEDAANHPQALANEYIAEVDHPKDGRIRVLGLPVKLHKTPGRVGLPPDLGQHTDAVLAQAGYTTAEIAQMQEEGVI